jgi:hypothetical protein
MSRKSNSNPDHYKTAGRGRQGQDVIHEVERQKLKEKKARSSRAASRPAPLAGRKKPPQKSRTAEPSAEPPTTPTDKDFAENLQSSGKRGKTSMAQKRSASRYGLDPIPAARAVGGAYAKRKRAAGIIAAREEYDRTKQLQAAKKKTAAQRKRATKRKSSKK